MADSTPPRMVGLNHIALKVGDLDGGAIIDLGDEFLALIEGPARAPRGYRHFGLVVDDRSAVQALAEAAGAEHLPGPSLDFLDPWGNCVEVVEYRGVQFTKADAVLRSMGLAGAKTGDVMRQLTDTGMVSEARPAMVG